MAWVGKTGSMIASGSSDNTLKLWSLDGKEQHSLEGHTSRIWDVSSNERGDLIATASGDSTIRVSK